jgi:hypothetical protein
VKARIGDHIIVNGARIGTERRIGIIIGVEDPDGGPPYHVHWLNDGRTTLFFPGPETRIQPGHGSQVGSHG